MIFEVKCRRVYPSASGLFFFRLPSICITLISFRLFILLQRGGEGDKCH